MKCICGFDNSKITWWQSIRHIIPPPFIELRIMTSGTYGHVSRMKGQRETLWACPKCKTVRIE